MGSEADLADLINQKAAGFYGFRRKSDWKFDTSTSKGGTVGPVTGGAGDLIFKGDPYGRWWYHYAWGGAGLVSKGAPIALTQSTEKTYSGGDIFLSDRFPGEDLTVTDFEGWCIIADASVAGGLGAAMTAILVGIPWKALSTEGSILAAGPLPVVIDQLFGTHTVKALQSRAKALVLVRSLNSGVQLGAGISASLGRIWLGDYEWQEAPIPSDALLPEYIPIEHRIGQSDDTLTLPGDVLFPFNRPWPTEERRYVFEPKATNALNEVTSHVKALLLKRTIRRIQIYGYTDSVGSVGFNLELSRRRANAVAEWLIARKVVDPKTVRAEGLGKTNFVASNTRPDGSDNPVGRQKNRRVEINLLS